MIKVDLNEFRNSEFKIVHLSEIVDNDHFDYPELTGSAVILDPALGPTLKVMWSIKGQYRDQDDYSGNFTQQEALADGSFDYDDLYVEAEDCSNCELYDTGFGDDMDLSETMKDFFVRSDKVKRLLLSKIRAAGFDIFCLNENENEASEKDGLLEGIISQLKETNARLQENSFKL